MISREKKSKSNQMSSCKERPWEINHFVHLKKSLMAYNAGKNLTKMYVEEKKL